MSDYTTNYTRGYLVGRKKIFLLKTLCSGKKNTKPIFDFLDRKSIAFSIPNIGNQIHFPKKIFIFFLTFKKNNGINKVEVVK